MQIVTGIKQHLKTSVVEILHCMLGEIGAMNSVLYAIHWFVT